MNFATIFLLLCVSISASFHTCETSLIALKKGALELENRLQDCLARNISQVTTTSASTPLSGTVIPPAVDEACQISLESALSALRDQVQNSSFLLDELTKTQSALEQLKKEFKAMSIQHDSELAQIKDAFRLTKEELEAEQERLEAALTNAETLLLHATEEKSPLLLDWTTHLTNLSVLLDLTEEKMHQMSLASLIFLLDEETSDRMSGYVTWSVLLLPLILSFCLLVKVKLSLERMVLWAGVYLFLLFLLVFGLSFWFQGDAIQVLPRSVHDVLVILLMIGQFVFWTSMLVLSLKQWLVVDLGGMRVRHVIQLAIPTLSFFIRTEIPF
jgi:hypothetical protein